MSAPAEPARTLLLVDDDAFICGIVQKVLTRHGYHILAAQSGEEAIRLSQAHPGPIDVVISDLMMPELNGQETVRRLRADRPGLPVIFISGYTEDEVPPPDPTQPPSLYLAKPFAMAELVQAVQSLLA